MQPELLLGRLFPLQCNAPSINLFVAPPQQDVCHSPVSTGAVFVTSKVGHVGIARTAHTSLSLPSGTACETGEFHFAFPMVYSGLSATILACALFSDVRHPPSIVYVVCVRESIWERTFIPTRPFRQMADKVWA